MSIGSEQEFISLQEAAKLCQYTQEYLSLRARQKKLRAVKIGRNWFTTVEWLVQYVDKATDYKEQAKQNQKSGLQTTAPYVRVLPDPPANLPIEEVKEVFERVRSAPSPAVAFQESLKIGFAFAVVLVMIGVSTVLGRGNFEDVTNDVYPVVRQTSQTVATSVPVFAASNSAVFAGSASETGKEYAAWLWQTISQAGSVVTEQIRSAHFAVVNWVRSLGERVGTRFVRDDAPQVSPPPQAQTPHPQEVPQPPTSPQQGLVVVPSSDRNAEIRAQVEQSFSDEVRIIQQDEETGIITPLFREREGSDYFYILVPLQEQ